MDGSLPAHTDQLRERCLPEEDVEEVVSGRKRKQVGAGPTGVMAEPVRTEVPLRRSARIRRITERMKEFLEKQGKQARVGGIRVISPETRKIKNGRDYIRAVNGRVDSIRHVAIA